MRIYGDLTSGNCLKVKYTADFLGLPYAWITVSALDGETKEPHFLARNPMGQIPVVELDDGRHLAQSNAIIRYLARGSALLPDDAFVQAKIDEWLFWEQYSHEPYIAVCRFHMLYLKRPKDAREAWRVERGEKALDLMESHFLAASDTPAARRPEAVGPVLAAFDTPAARRPEPVGPFLVGDTFSIADIALLAYTRAAHEGGFNLRARPNVQAWIKKCEAALPL